MQIRTDLADCGVYVFSFPIYKLMLHLVQLEKDFWTEIGIAEDFLPFMIRNQFKESLNKYYEEAQSKDKSKNKQVEIMNKIEKSLEMMMNPDKEIKQDKIKIMVHIDHMHSGYQVHRIKSIKAFKRANLEGQKIQLNRRMDATPHLLFGLTVNSLPDL